MEQSRPLGLHIQGLWFLAPREALPFLQQDALLVDLRMPELIEMKAFSVPSQVRLGYPILAGQAAELPKDRLLILADSSGVYTKGAAAALQALGFERIACLNGGMLAWDQDGLPLATDPAALLYGACPCSLKPTKDRSPSPQEPR